MIRAVFQGGERSGFEWHALKKCVVLPALQEPCHAAGSPQSPPPNASPSKPAHASQSRVGMLVEPCAPARSSVSPLPLLPHHLQILFAEYGFEPRCAR